MSRRFVSLLPVLLLSVACINSLEPDVGEPIAGSCKNADSDPDVDVSFSAELMPLFQGMPLAGSIPKGCGCHNPSLPTGGSAIDVTGFSVGDYAAIRRGGQTSRDMIVVPGDPCGSFIYKKLSAAPPSGVRMPSSGPYWSLEEMRILHDWIAEGARAN